MRLSVAAACLCCCLVGFSSANDAHASIRKETNIPAEGLGPALNALAKDRNFQIVYVTEEIANVHTDGAVGEFTTEEALKKLLTGTGLTFRYLDDKTITIGSATGSQVRGDRTSQSTSAGSSGDANANQEGRKNSSGEFRTAQVDQGANPRASAVGSDTSAAQKASNRPGLEEIVVTSHYEFLSVDTSGTTNLPIPIEKVPQSISLVSNDFIEAADLKTLGEIAEYTPGAINAGTPLNTASNIMLRGFSAATTIDGLNAGGAFFEPDYAIYDRLEFVKGPSSVVYGTSSPGGLVNFVTKSATPQTKDYLYAQGGSWDNYRFEGQIAGAVDSNNHIRAIGVGAYDRGNSFIDQLYHANTVLYGGLDVDFTDALTGFIHAGYERQARTVFDGIPTQPDGTPPPLPRSFCICSRDVDLTTNVYFVSEDLTWRATDMLDLSVKSHYESSGTFGSSGFGQNLAANGDMAVYAEVVPRSPPTFNDQFSAGVSSLYRFDDLGLKNSFVSLSALYQYNSETQNVLFAGGTANIYNGEAAITQLINTLVAQAAAGSLYLTGATSNQVTISTQSILRPIDPLTLLLGASYSSVSETAANGGVPQDFNPPGEMSYRAGVSYEILPSTNVYASFSQSFQPNLVLAASGSILPNSIGEQYEGGVKYRSENGRLLLTGALYRIRETNIAEFGAILNGIEYKIPIGEVTHKGVELQALGQITPQWQVNAGYTYLDPKITTAASSQATTVGQTELFLPKNTFSLFTTYSIPAGTLSGLSVGGGVRYVGAEQTSYSNSPTPTKAIPAYTLVDAIASYKVDKWLVQLNARNILDKHYFINNYQALVYGNEQGAPTNFALSLRRTF
jgi:outer-membrane receptor for ferric coprogen and ferric-rhodotorulic acid